MKAMGKHERGDVKVAEKNLNRLLNGKNARSSFGDHRLFASTRALAKRIKSDFPGVRRSQHIGDSYDSTGDLKITLEDGREIYIEVKFLNLGKGTRANIGQDSLTDFQLFKNPEVVSWSSFRKKKNHTKWVREYLDEYGNYPKKTKALGEKKEELYKKAAFLKKILMVGNRNAERVARLVLSSPTSRDKKKAAKIVLKIMERDRAEKIKYINYLSSRRQNNENIKKFLYLILAGNHTSALLKRNWGVKLSKIIKTLEKNYYIYYVYRKEEPLVERESYTNKLKRLKDKEIFISFPKNQTNVLLCFTDEAKRVIPVLRVVVHWKNKFQGIETPCLNIFDERYLS